MARELQKENPDFGSQRERDKVVVSPAWLMVFVMMLVGAALCLAFVLPPGFLRGAAVAGILGLALFTFAIQFAVQFPLETAIAENMVKGAQRAKSQAVHWRQEDREAYEAGAMVGAAIVQTRATGWLWLWVVLLLGAGSAFGVEAGLAVLRKKQPLYEQGGLTPTRSPSIWARLMGLPPGPVGLLLLAVTFLFISPCLYCGVVAFYQRMAEADAEKQRQEAELAEQQRRQKEAERERDRQRALEERRQEEQKQLDRKREQQRREEEK
jgi:hypothetical protein